MFERLDEPFVGEREKKEYVIIKDKVLRNRRK